MRQVLLGLAIVMLVSPSAPAGAQQGSIQISAAAQGVTGEPGRVARQERIEPDFGITWLQPGSRFGTFNLELRGTDRSGRPHLGRASAALRDVKYRGVSWTFEGGDTYFTPSIRDYRFANLFTPSVTFTGGAVDGRTKDSSLTLLTGRATALRNIFGSDPDALGQTLAVGRATHRLSPEFELQLRASDVRTRGLKEFRHTIAASRQAGGGVRLMLTPAIQLVGDGAFVAYRREGTSEMRQDVSFLGGTSWLLARGWLQINAFRFSPGEFPALNYPLQDREGLFAAGEYDVFSRFRVFGGIDSFRANLRPADSAASSSPAPGTNGDRRFGGFRFELWPRSTLTVRLEDGDRRARPVRAGFGAPTDSDTGAWSAEWQAILGRATTFTRYSRRQNVDRSNAAGSFIQHDASAQLFMTMSRSVQLFALTVMTHNALAEGGGSTYWQAGGGTQVQVPRRSLWVRAEGTLSRNIDLLSDSFVPRESLSLGLSGQLARQTTIGFNVYVDRAPVSSPGGNPWLTRSTLRLTHTISTGAARVSAGPTGAPTAARHAGTGSIVGSVFADWNANGTVDANEGPLEGIPVRVAALTAATTGRNGQFSFLNVPAGVQEVGLDTSALPIDFDPPAQPSVQVELTRGATQRVAFGLIPLGSITGRIVRDANANGIADPGEEPIDGAIVVLDGGARSEQTRRGRFRFDAVRSGEHTVHLLLDSVGEGARTSGPATLPAALTREQSKIDLTFVVSIEKRPEIRKVFPSKSGAADPRGGAPDNTRAASGDRGSGIGARGSGRGTGRSGLGTRGSGLGTGGSGLGSPGSAPERAATASSSRPARYTIQIAALHDPLRAKRIVSSLQASGYAAYLIEPPPSDPNGPFRIRVGQFASMAAAEKTRARLEQERGEKLWVTRDRR